MWSVCVLQPLLVIPRAVLWYQGVLILLILGVSPRSNSVVWVGLDLGIYEFITWTKGPTKGEGWNSSSRGRRVYSELRVFTAAWDLFFLWLQGNENEQSPKGSWLIAWRIQLCVLSAMILGSHDMKFNRNHEMIEIWDWYEQLLYIDTNSNQSSTPQATNPPQSRQKLLCIVWLWSRSVDWGHVQEFPGISTVYFPSHPCFVSHGFLLSIINHQSASIYQSIHPILQTPFEAALLSYLNHFLRLPSDLLKRLRGKQLSARLQRPGADMGCLSM